jgi:hypothetical protein
MVGRLSWKSAEDYDPYFYGVSTQPPTVVEFNMQDIENVVVHKIYILDEGGPI